MLENKRKNLNVYEFIAHFCDSTKSLSKHEPFNFFVKMIKVTLNLLCFL